MLDLTCPTLATSTPAMRKICGGGLRMSQQHLALTLAALTKSEVNWFLLDLSLKLLNRLL